MSRRSAWAGSTQEHVAEGVRGVKRVRVAQLKQEIRGWRRSNRSEVRLAAEAMSLVWLSVKFCMDASWRSVVWLLLFRSRLLHQSEALTWMDRYPAIFSACRDYFAGQPDLRILSYGCATGEEVLTLRKYFPHAFIVGVEINRHSLRQCRQLKVDDRIAFMEPNFTRVAEAGPFDAIFCMAVLQRTPDLVEEKGIVDLTPIYPFEKFDRKVTELDSWLKSRGLLAIYNSQYLFSDASVSAKYEPLPAAADICDTGLKFDRKGRRHGNGTPNPSVLLKVQE